MEAICVSDNCEDQLQANHINSLVYGGEYCDCICQFSISKDFGASRARVGSPRAVGSEIFLLLWCIPRPFLASGLNEENVYSFLSIIILILASRQPNVK